MRLTPQPVKKRCTGAAGDVGGRWLRGRLPQLPGVIGLVLGEDFVVPGSGGIGEDISGWVGISEPVKG